MSTEPPLTRAPRRTSPGWVFLPALGAPLAHAPVLRWNLLPTLRRPISRRLFGENKTWRGALVMTGGTVAATLALHRLPTYRRRLPEPLAPSQSCPPGGACSEPRAGWGNCPTASSNAGLASRQGSNAITSRRGDLDLRPGRLGPNRVAAPAPGVENELPRGCADLRGCQAEDSPSDAPEAGRVCRVA